MQLPREGEVSARLRQRWDDPSNSLKNGREDPSATERLISWLSMPIMKARLIAIKSISIPIHPIRTRYHSSYGSDRIDRRRTRFFREYQGRSCCVWSRVCGSVHYSFWRSRYENHMQHFNTQSLGDFGELCDSRDDASGDDCQ